MSCVHNPQSNATAFVLKTENDVEIEHLNMLPRSCGRSGRVQNQLLRPQYKRVLPALFGRVHLACSSTPDTPLSRSGWRRWPSAPLQSADQVVTVDSPTGAHAIRSTAEASDVWQSWVKSSLVCLSGKRLLRSLKVIKPTIANTTHVLRDDGTKAVVFATNDYLGLSGHPEVRASAAAAADAYGCGPRSSALICGYTDAHRDLEDNLARLKGTEASLLFPTGFAANLSAIGALASSAGVALFSDAFNHASIVDGARLAVKGGAQLRIYKHNDLNHLEQLLRASTAPRKMIISDSLFSMDGDLADCVGRESYGPSMGVVLQL